jgi:hypothetical protein
MADTRSDIPEQDLTGPRSFKVEHLDFKWFACFPGNSGTCLHQFLTPLMVVIACNRIFA